MTRNSLKLVPLLLTLWSPWATGEAAAAPVMLADSTVVEHWTLANSLQVTTRHIPGARAVAVTVAYGFGTDDDPAGREGLAQLLAEIGFTAAAGEIPERTREELESQRPLGWSFLVSRRTTLFTEIASVEQFPGVLSQVARRMRGVTPSKEALRTAVQNVRIQMNDQLFGPPVMALYHQVREVALNRSDDAILRRAAGTDLGRLTVAEVQQHLGRLHVPANAALSLAGNLEEVDVHALVKNLFGDIPAGASRESPAPSELKPRTRTMRLAQAREAAGVVGVIGPALTDSLHPSFLVGTIVLGSHLTRTWHKPGEPAVRYQYKFFDEPDLVRIFPPVDAAEDDPEALTKRLGYAINGLRAMIVTSESYEEAKSSMTWLMGGPMSEELRERVGRDSGLLHTLARSLAVLALRGGHSFWADYRKRLEDMPAGGILHWTSYYDDPSHQVRLLFTPARTGPR